jgi:Predicted transcriptional regulators
MTFDDDKNIWYKIGDVANQLNVKNHIIRHYTEKLGNILGENVRVDPLNNFTMYNSEAIKILANVKKMVQVDHMTLNEVKESLTEVESSKLPAKFDLDAAASFAYIKDLVISQQAQIDKLINVLGILTGKLEGFDQFPTVIKSYHDDVNNVFQHIDKIEQGVQLINDIKPKLDAYENENNQLKQLICELKERTDRTESVIRQELANSVKSILEENEKQWAVLKMAESKKESEKKWWKFWG